MCFAKHQGGSAEPSWMETKVDLYQFQWYSHTHELSRSLCSYRGWAPVWLPWSILLQDSDYTGGTPFVLSRNLLWLLLEWVRFGLIPEKLGSMVAMACVSVSYVLPLLFICFYCIISFFLAMGSVINSLFEDELGIMTRWDLLQGETPIFDDTWENFVFPLVGGDGACERPLNPLL